MLQFHAVETYNVPHEGVFFVVIQFLLKAQLRTINFPLIYFAFMSAIAPLVMAAIALSVALGK
jgi:hypothetical protein